MMSSPRSVVAGCGRGAAAFPLPDDGLEPRDVAPDGPHLDRALELAGGQLEPEVRKVLLLVGQPLLQLVDRQILAFQMLSSRAPFVCCQLPFVSRAGH